MRKRKAPRVAPKPALLVPKDIIKEDLRTPKYRLRVIRDRTKYDRKRLPKPTEWVPKVSLNEDVGGRMLVAKI